MAEAEGMMVGTVASVSAMSASKAAHSSSSMAADAAGLSTVTPRVVVGSVTALGGGREARSRPLSGRTVGMVVEALKKSAGRAGPRESGCDENSDEMMDEEEIEDERGCRPLVLLVVVYVVVVDVFVRTVF